MIKKTRKNIVCNEIDCENMADFELLLKKKKNILKVFLCRECFKNMYFEMGKFVVPKSPQNILNRFRK